MTVDRKPSRGASLLEPSSPEAAGMRPERIDLVKQRAASWVAEGETPSLILLAARHGKIFLHEAWGQQRPGGRALETSSIFPVASVSKVITTTLAMILVEDGLLGLNRPARSYLPELTGEGTDQILVHHLMTHTSGLDQLVVDRQTVKNLKRGIQAPSEDETQHLLVGWLLELRWSTPVSHPPGEKMMYADQNFVLLGEIVRRISGESLESFARDRLFGPLGMNDTWFEVPESERERVILRPKEAPQPAPDNPFFDGLDGELSQSLPYGNGGVFSTAQDAARFGQAFLDGGCGVLSPATVAHMTRNRIPGIGIEFRSLRYREASWGLGWMIQGVEKWRYFAGDLQSPGGFLHPGFGGVFLWIDRRNEIVGVFFSVAMKVTEDWEAQIPADLFQNIISSAVVD